MKKLLVVLILAFSIVGLANAQDRIVRAGEQGTINLPPPAGQVGPSCFSEEFENGLGAWTQNDNSVPGPVVWTTSANTTDCLIETDNFGPLGNVTGGAGEAACISSDIFGASNAIDTTMCAPPVDLSGLTSASMSMLVSMITFTDTDSLVVSANGATVATLLPNLGTAFAPPGSFETVDLSAYAGNDSVEVCLTYEAGWDFYVEVDEIEINGGVNDATCVAVPDDATFTVTKDFTDGNPAGVDVTLDCFQGLPITQTQTVSEAQNVVFTVQDFAQGELDCNLTESGSSGYTASYEDGDGASAVNCSWQDLTGGDYSCRVTNTPDSVEITVSKDWVIEGESVNYIDPSYSLTLRCSNPIVGGFNSEDRAHLVYYKSLYNGDSNGTSDVDYFADVIPNWDGGTECVVDESHFDSAIESSNGCGNLLINIVEDETDVRSCTITNTVFFEGIPSLNQYGLAILALLMLSVGFVGFRRFV